MSRVLRRNFGFMSAAVACVALLQYALYFVVAGCLGVEDYGSFAIALTMAVLAAPLCDLGMNVALVFTHSRDGDDLPGNLGASLAWRGMLLLPVGACTIGLGYLLGFSEQVLYLFVPLFLAAVCDSVGGLCSAMFQAREKMGYSACILLGRNIARATGLGCALLFTDVSAGGGLFMLALCWLSGSSTAALLSLLLLLRHTKIRFAKSTLLPVLRRGLPFGSAILANLCLLQSDILMLGWFVGDEGVGAYHAAFRFVVLLELFPQILSTVVLPRSYRTGFELGAVALSQLYRMQTVVLATAGTFAALLLALHGGLVVDLTLGSSFESSGVLLVGIAPMIFLRFMLVPLNDALTSLGGQGQLGRVAWTACVVNVALNVLLIPRLGVLGAVIATLSSQICMLILVARCAVQRGLQLDWRRVLAHPLALCVFCGSMVLVLRGDSTPTWLAPLLSVGLLAAIGFAPIREHRLLWRRAPREV